MRQKRVTDEFGLAIVWGWAFNGQLELADGAVFESEEHGAAAPFVETWHCPKVYVVGSQWLSAMREALAGMTPEEAKAAAYRARVIATRLRYA